MTYRPSFHAAFGSQSDMNMDKKKGDREHNSVPAPGYRLGYQKKPLPHGMCVCICTRHVELNHEMKSYFGVPFCERSCARKIKTATFDGALVRNWEVWEEIEDPHSLHQLTKHSGHRPVKRKQL